MFAVLSDDKPIFISLFVNINLPGWIISKYKPCKRLWYWIQILESSSADFVEVATIDEAFSIYSLQLIELFCSFQI